MLSEDKILKKLHSQNEKDKNRARRVKKEAQHSVQKKQKLITRLKFQILDHVKTALGVNSMERIEPKLNTIIKDTNIVDKKNKVFRKKIQKLQNENQNLKQQQNISSTQPTSNVANNADSTTNQGSSSASAMYHDKYGNPETLAQHKHNEKVNELFSGE